MTSRERLLTVLRGGEPDQIPWSPCIDGYFLASLPKNMRMSVVEAFRYIGADAMVRHVQTFKTSVYDSGTPSIVESKNSNIDFIEKKKGNQVWYIYKTPVGTIKERWERREQSPYMLFPVEYKIKTVEDLKIYKYIIENQDYETDFENFCKEDKHIGKDGLATTDGPFTPLQYLLMFGMGIQTFYYMLFDYKREMEELIALMDEKNKKAYKIVAESPAEVVFIYENTSTTTVSPDIYKSYEMKYIDEYADILHKTDKIFITHMCGKLRGLTDLIGQGKQNGISEITPSPTGDLDIAESRKIWGKDKIIIGGLEPTALTQLSTLQIETYVKDILTRVSTGDNFILGSGDAVPYGTPIENLKTITNVIKKYGKYPVMLS